ncbi:hypothetical protein D3C86_1451410 [compost metagenome]
MLNQVAFTDPILMGAAQQSPHGTQLMKAREHLLSSLLAFLVFLCYDLRKALDDIGQRRLSQYMLPQVVRLDAMRIGRIARTAVPALIERQEPRRLAGQMGTETHLGIINRHVCHATSQLKQQFARVAVGLILGDRIRDGLLGQGIF